MAKAFVYMTWSVLKSCLFKLPAPDILTSFVSWVLPLYLPKHHSGHFPTSLVSFPVGRDDWSYWFLGSKSDIQCIRGLYAVTPCLCRRYMQRRPLLLQQSPPGAAGFYKSLQSILVTVLMVHLHCKAAETFSPQIRVIRLQGISLSDNFSSYREIKPGGECAISNACTYIYFLIC